MKLYNCAQFRRIPLPWDHLSKLEISKATWRTLGFRSTGRSDPVFVSKGRVLCTALVGETKNSQVKLRPCVDAKLLSCPAGRGLISSGPQWKILGSADLSILQKRRREGEDLFVGLPSDQQLIPEEPRHIHADQVFPRWLGSPPPSLLPILWICPHSCPAQGPDSWTQPSSSRLWSSCSGLAVTGSSLAAGFHESWRPGGGWEAWPGRSRKGLWDVLWPDGEASNAKED